MAEKVKIVVTVPESHADAVRDAAGKAGAGKLGRYSFCSFSVKGTGRFRPDAGAKPYAGSVGQLESVAEERIEFTCDRDILESVIAHIRKAHPYEEIALDVYPLI